MKKCIFYSLMFKDNKKQAVKQNGYTDGMYNYYKSFSTWYAICDSVGLSVATAQTRKAAAEKAHSLTAQAKERLQTMSGAVEEFTRYKTEAEQA